MRGAHRYRVHATAVGTQHHFAIDHALRGRQEGFKIGLDGVVIEAFVHQLHPLARNFGLEAVLLFGQHRFFQRAMRGEQCDQARRFKHDAAFQSNRGIAGVHAAAHAVLRKHRIEFGQDFFAGEYLPIQRHRLPLCKPQAHLHCLGRPLLAARAPTTRTVAGGFPTVNFATGHGQAQQVFIDGVRLLLGTHSKAAIFQIRLLIGAGLGVLFLDFTDRRNDAVLALRLHCQVKAHLVIAHAGAAMRDGIGTQCFRPRQRGIHDQIAVRHQ